MKNSPNGNFLHLCLIAFAALISLMHISFVHAEDLPSENLETLTTGTIEDLYGIRILGVRLSAAGYMLDFRYRVLDPEKAKTLFKGNNQTYLIDHATGSKLIVPSPPKVGPLRSSRQYLADRNYFMFFANPGRLVKSGGTVTIVVGDVKFENLIVQ